MIPSDLFSDALIYAVGWTIVHTLWQGAVVAAILAIALACARRITPNTRYLLSATGLLLIAGMAVPTFISLYTPETAFKVIKLPVTAHSQPANEAGMPVLAAGIAPAPGDIITEMSAWLDAGIPAIVTLWFIGMFLFTAKFLADFAYTNRLRRREVFPPSPYWKSRFEDLRYLTNVRKSVGLVESALVQVPIVIGAIKPVILLPLGTLTGLPAQQIEAIIAHELAHIRRHDYLVNILQTLVTILFFYHPAVWWLSSRMRIEREHCCDDIAIAVSGSPIALAKALAGLQERALAPRTALAAAGADKYHLLNRIRRIAGQPGKHSTPVERGVAICVLVTALFLFGLNAHSSLVPDTQEPPAPPAATQPPTPPTIAAVIAAAEPDDSVPSPSAPASTSDTYVIRTWTTDSNGKQQRVEATLSNNGEFQTLSIDGKAIPPSEFGNYSVLLNQLKEEYEATIKEHAKAMEEHAQAMKESEEAMKEARKAEEEYAQAMREFAKAEAEAKAMEAEAKAMAEEMEAEARAMAEATETRAMAEAMGARAEAWASQNARQIEEKMEAWSKEFEKEMARFKKEMEKFQEEGINADNREAFQQQMEKLQKAVQKFTAKSTETAVSETYRQGMKELKTAVQEARKELKKSSKQAPKQPRTPQQSSKAAQTELDQALLKDKLITSTEKYELKLTDTELVVNGKKQPKEMLEKYKKFFSDRKQFKPGVKLHLRKDDSE